VDRDVGQVIAPRRCAADRVIEREREVEQRTALDRETLARRLAKADLDRPELADRGVFRDREQVVEDEGAERSVGADEADCGDEGERAPAVGTRFRAGLRSGAPRRRRNPNLGGAAPSALWALSGSGWSLPAVTT